MTKQKLILLFDGTWNDPQDRTNVFRLAQRLHEYDGNVRQRFFYDPGVGTGWPGHYLGGITGYGLSDNLREGYEWLAKRYTDGDDIWLFGFSRGAYTARSLAGLIRKCGLLRIVTPGLLDEAEALYRDGKLNPDDESCHTFKHYYGHTPRIHFIGVWDTVGALGVPGTNLSEHGKYSWHDTELSSTVDYAYHAVALDEHRAAYEVPLWVSRDGKQKADNRDVEQRWFIGAHANVGGGYGDDPLADISLQWMSEKAAAAGLALDAFTAATDAWQTAPTDSFSPFMCGLYARWNRIRHSGDGRHYRPFAQGLEGKPAINVTVDPSVWQRWNDEGYDYRPRTLEDAGKGPPE
ncbi:DUF2235 domain-containing protein [Halomonas piscis]|uniref:DUF2235 domain-containing protein n=1 Tax=Halomonas piscis TaxID=3031727 RepID=A0ABY9Z0N9_9GAMM|nr:DUF2235 domain-containing protein [Halomonas piscis]WNK20699.1 DUF2235 domain-containing protein [Halomonas piscis]